MTDYLDGPVAIIGRGIGGLTAALSLQHFGVPVRVFEQARALREIGAGVTITPNAMSALDFLGIGQVPGEQAGETPRYFVRSAADGLELERGPDPGPDSFVPEFGASYRNLHRADLHVALTDAVIKSDPDAIALDHRFEHLEQGGDQVVAHFSNRASFAAPALIGADGGASAVRNAVFGGQDASAEGWSIPATVPGFLGLFDDFPEPVRELIAAVPGPDVFKWGLRDRELLPVWTRGRVSMLGDAAHPMTPYLGQGACMAIEDGMVLGRAFAASADLAEAFSRYEAARRERANGVQLAARFQGTQHHGSTASGPNSGKTAVALGLFSYNPVTEPV
jgi:salicylate hydroxylase